MLQHSLGFAVQIGHRLSGTSFVSAAQSKLFVFPVVHSVSFLTVFVAHHNIKAPRLMMTLIRLTYCSISLQSKSFQTTASSGFQPDNKFHAAMHSFSMRYLRFTAHGLPWNGVDVVVWETDGLFWCGWLVAWLSGKRTVWLGFTVRGESKPHELFSFIWRCYHCGLSASVCLPHF